MRVQCNVHHIKYFCPRALEQGVYALEQHGMFIDIGTPEDYARAQTMCQSLYEAASPNS